MGIIFILMAGSLAATSNYFLRRSIDAGGSSKAYLVIQLGLAFLVAILLNPVKAAEYGWSAPIAIVGLIGGVTLGVMMYSLGKSLQYGPPGLTFAIINASSVMPAIVMALLFGAIYGHDYTPWNAAGSVLVVIGLFWAGWQTGRSKDIKLWLTLALVAFLCHVALLVFMQWRAMLIKPELPYGPLLSFRVDAALSHWFMPMIFFAAAAVQLIVYFSSEKRLPNRKEVMYGVAGGAANGVCTYFLIKATEVATVLENAMLFPIYSVTIIVLCNIWGQLLYKEKVNWVANMVCLAGLVAGTVDWTAIKTVTLE